MCVFDLNNQNERLKHITQINKHCETFYVKNDEKMDVKLKVLQVTDKRYYRVC